MADFSFVSNARFRPFSYQEMLQPIQAYTQEYNTVEEGIGELAAKADVYKQIANEQSDPIAHAQWKKYADDLAVQAVSLANEGLTPSSRRGLLDMKRRYASEITPIELAFESKRKQTGEWFKMKAQDGTLISSYDPSITSLDEYLKNPNLTPQFVSGKAVHDAVFQSAQQLARSVRQDPREARRILGDQYFELVQKKGYSPEEIMRAMRNTEEGRKELKRIKEEVISSYGVRNWATEGQMRQIDEHANRGLWGAIGDYKYETLANQEYKNKGKSSSDQAVSFIDTRIPVGTRVNNDFKKMNLDKLSVITDPRTGEITNILTQELADRQNEIDRMSDEGIMMLTDPTAGPMRTGNSQYITHYPKKEAQEALNKDKEYLKEINRHYSFYKDNPEKNLKKAYDLEKAQSMEQLNSYAVSFADSSVSSDIGKNIQDLFSSQKGDVNAASVYEEGKKKKKLKVDEVRDLISEALDPSNKSGLSIQFAPGVGPVIADRRGKGAIVLDEIPVFKRMSQRTEATNEFLRNFKDIHPVEASKLENVNTDQQMYQAAQRYGKSLGNDLYGINIRLEGGGIKNIVVDVSDPNNITWYNSSSEDEIAGGQVRQQNTVAQLRTDFLRQFGTLRGNRVPSATMPAKASWVSNGLNTYDIKALTNIAYQEEEE